VDLRQVLTSKEYDELLEAAERYGSTNAITNAFKSDKNLQQDRGAINKLFMSPEGRALTTFLVASLKAVNQGQTASCNEAVRRGVFDSYVAKLAKRSDAFTDPAASLDQNLLKILRQSKDPNVLQRARIWLDKQKGSMSDQNRAAWLGEIRKHANTLILVGVPIGEVHARLADAATSRVVDAAQRGFGTGGAKIARRGAGGDSMSASTGARFEDTLAGLGHGTNPESESQRDLRAATSCFPGYETTDDAAFETSAFGETPERFNTEPARTSAGHPVILDFGDPPHQEPSAPQGPAASEPAALPEPAVDVLFSLMDAVRKSPHVSNDKAIVDLQAALKVCAYDVDATVRLMLVRASLPQGVDLAVTDAIARRGVLASMDTEFLHASLGTAVTRVTQSAAIRRKASDNVSTSEVKSFAKATWPDFDPTALTVESFRRKHVAERIVGLAEGGTASRARQMDEERKVCIAKACMALPPTLNDFDAVIIAEAALRETIGAGADFPSLEALAALGEIVHAVLHPRAPGGD
jgi:hypothetical protein